MAGVYLALGTNLGARRANLARALDLLRPWVAIRQVAPLYETAPWGVLDQPSFLNTVIEGETTLAPEDLLRQLKRIERQMGRTEGVRYGPRLIDLDILFYNNRVYKSDDLEIPHPRLAERRFVLVPLADLAPDLVHPVLGESVTDLLRRLPDAGDVKPYLASE